MKGIEQGSGKRLTQVVEEFLPAVPVAVWVGPGHVQNYVQKIPNCRLWIPKTKILPHESYAILTHSLCVYTSVKILWAPRWVQRQKRYRHCCRHIGRYGIYQLKGCLMARGAREVSRLIKAMGGNELTAYGLSHLGDYEATLFSLYSNNRKVWRSFCKKRSL